VGTGLFSSYEQGVGAMVSLERAFEPDPRRHEWYESRFDEYKRLWPLMRGYLRGLA